jgi:hypothetical protein
MSAAVPHHVFSYREYLERETETGLKHEFLRGQIYAMAGDTPEHARLIPAGQDHAGAFLHRVAGRGEELTISCLGGALSVDDLYVGAL